MELCERLGSVGLAAATAVQVAATTAGAGQLDSYRMALLVPVGLGVIGVGVTLPRAWRAPQACAAVAAQPHP